MEEEEIIETPITEEKEEMSEETGPTEVTE